MSHYAWDAHGDYSGFITVFLEKSEDEWWESEDTSWLLLFSACSGNQPKIQLICQESPNEEMSGKYQMLKFVLDFLKTANTGFLLN